MLEARRRLEATAFRIDVFDALAELDVLVVFRPLDGLLGAYLRGTPPGVLISTNRSHTIQRFTAAHELGHAVLQHEPSLDTPDVLRRAATAGGKGNLSFQAYLQEVEADAFAGEFLLPQWLLIYHARQQGWSRGDLSRPDIAYQLAVRCGASFDATTRALERNQLITPQAGNVLRSVKPKQIKSTIRTDESWSNPWADTWSFSERDFERNVIVPVGDIIRVALRQASASGFLWEVEAPSALRLVADETEIDLEEIGSPTDRMLTFQVVEEATAALRLTERRPWEPTGETSSLHVTSIAAESGLSRANRVRMAA